MPLLEFITSIANSLRLAEEIRSSGRPKKHSLSPTPIVARKAAVPKTTPDVRYDSVDHFLEFNEKRNRCRFCPDGYSYVSCSKCEVVLCLRKEKMIFLTPIIEEIILRSLLFKFLF